MCGSRESFLCFSLDRGCIVIGVLTLFLSAVTIILCIIGFSMEDVMLPLGGKKEMMVKIETNKVLIVLFPVIVISILGVFNALLLLYGVVKNKSNFILAYFFYGNMVTMLLVVTALLELLEFYWILACLSLLFAVLYIYSLVVVHSVYDLMLKGIIFGNNEHQLLEEEI